MRDYAEEHGLERPERDIRPRAIQNHNRAHKYMVPPWLGERTTITQADARDLPYSDGMADLVVTSPPYMQVLDYTWNNWIRLWWLGDVRKQERENIDITADVEKYRRFMRECLVEMYRMMAPESIAVLVVGDVKKNLAAGPRTLNTAGIIAEEALQHTEFEVHGAIADAYDIDNRGYLVFNQLKYDHNQSKKGEKAGVPIDRCLILTKGYTDLPEKPKIDWKQEPYKAVRE